MLSIGNKNSNWLAPAQGLERIQHQSARKVFLVVLRKSPFRKITIQKTPFRLIAA